ncbi:MAG TPA: hypothetical protein VF247_00860 [Candidatus Krumholzibacteria bacterium]
MKKGLLIGLGAALAALAVKRFTRNGAPVGDPVEPRVVDAGQVADYAGMSATTYRVNTARDVLPGGLSAAMSPVFVVWDRSSFAPGGSITIRNLNHGGNPVGGFTVLRTAVLHPDRVQRVEYVRVPLGGPDAISHGQLRFVFESGGIEMEGGDCSVAGEPETIEDIVLSWEAWRPPGTSYSMLKGMDPTFYQLTLRAYSGVQRFIEDALQARDWESYPLQLPGGRAGMIELLKVSLTLGDGAGRYVMSEMLKYTGDAWVKAGPSGEHHGDVSEAWSVLQERLDSAPAPSDDRLEMAGLTGYHTAIRSCASMALYQIDVTTSRLAEQGHAHRGGRAIDMAGITEIPEWMNELAGSNVAGLFLRGHHMIAFVRRYPSSVPGNIPKQLDRAGLLVRENGKPVKSQFTIDGETPWGPAHRLLVR